MEERQVDVVLAVLECRLNLPLGNLEIKDDSVAFEEEEVSFV